MGLTKKELFSPAQNELAAAAKILAHPARIAILQHLVNSKTCINGDLVEELGLAQPTISQHLKELRDSGIIQGSIEGVSVCYCIDPVRWQALADLFQSFFSSLPHQEDHSCC